MDSFTLFLVLAVFHLAWSPGYTLQSPSHPTRIQYSRELLLRWNVLDPPGDLTVPNPVDLLGSSGCQKPPEGQHCKTRKRGRRGGVRLRKKQPLSRIPLPSIILSNAQSLRNKSEELQALVRFNHDFRESCILAFTESWLSNRDSNADLEIDGFGTPIRLDRDTTTTGKATGGGVCLYVNERWCNIKSVIVRERLCTPDIELLSVSLRPPYLPREFPQIFITLIYIHPGARGKSACEQIH